MPPPLTCCGIKRDGQVCGLSARNGVNGRCRTHYNALVNFGVVGLVNRELDDWDANRRLFRFIPRDDIFENADLEVRERINEIKRLTIEDVIDLRPIIETKEQIERELRERNALDEELFGPNRINRRLNFRQEEPPQPQPQPQPDRELMIIGQDDQNVHTALMVQRTQEIVGRVLQIEVDDEFKWSTTVLSKTLGDIFMTCKMTPTLAAITFNLYVSRDNVYDLGVGIYGRTMDSIWQYIKTSPHKDDLCNILKQEIKDGVGMCAQGTLTRLCNVLAGYLEGMGETHESPSSILQRRMPALMNIEDEDERIEQAERLLLESGLPREEWDDWLDPMYDMNI